MQPDEKYHGLGVQTDDVCKIKLKFRRYWVKENSEPLRKCVEPTSATTVVVRMYTIHFHIHLRCSPSVDENDVPTRVRILQELRPTPVGHAQARVPRRRSRGALFIRNLQHAESQLGSGRSLAITYTLYE